MNTDTLALDFKSATLYAVRVVLHSADPARLTEALAQRMRDAGGFFENEPVVVDASRLEETVDWPALLAALRGHNLPPIGVVAEGANLEGRRRGRPDAGGSVHRRPSAARRRARSRAGPGRSPGPRARRGKPGRRGPAAPAAQAMVVNRPCARASASTRATPTWWWWAW